MSSSITSSRSSICKSKSSTSGSSGISGVGGEVVVHGTFQNDLAAMIETQTRAIELMVAFRQSHYKKWDKKAKHAYKKMLHVFRKIVGRDTEYMATDKYTPEQTTEKFRHRITKIWNGKTTKKTPKAITAAELADKVQRRENKVKELAKKRQVFMIEQQKRRDEQRRQILMLKSRKHTSKSSKLMIEAVSDSDSDGLIDNIEDLDEDNIQNNLMAQMQKEMGLSRNMNKSKLRKATAL